MSPDISIATGLEAIAIRLEPIAGRGEAIAIFSKAVAQRLLQHGQLLQRAKPPGSLGATTLALAPRCHGLQRLKRFHKAPQKCVCLSKEAPTGRPKDARNIKEHGLGTLQWDCPKKMPCNVSDVLKRILSH